MTYTLIIRVFEALQLSSSGKQGLGTCYVPHVSCKELVGRDVRCRAKGGLLQACSQ